MAKTMLITGSSSGVGEATAKLFAVRGFNVVATMRNPARAPHFGDLPNLMVERLDVEDVASIDQAIRAAQDKFGRIDLVINNAGYGQYGIFEQIPMEKVRENFEVNVFGVMNVMQRIIPIFRAQKGGIILNVSSCGGRIGIPASSIYISTKFALEGFTETVSHELASQNIVAKLYEPGAIYSPFHERSARENVGSGGITSYYHFLESTDASLMKLAAGAATTQTVAEDIFAAATDGTNRLRYCAPYGVEALLKAKRELDDEGYENFARSMFPGN